MVASEWHLPFYNDLPVTYSVHSIAQAFKSHNALHNGSETLNIILSRNSKHLKMYAAQVVIEV